MDFYYEAVVMQQNAVWFSLEAMSVIFCRQEAVCVTIDYIPCERFLH